MERTCARKKRIKRGFFPPSSLPEMRLRARKTGLLLHESSVQKIKNKNKKDWRRGWSGSAPTPAARRCRAPATDGRQGGACTL